MIKELKYNHKKNASSPILKNLLIRKVFYIMKVIYIYRINRLHVYFVRNVQQSLYMGKPKYILKILINR
jgi:hypothetical protein